MYQYNNVTSSGSALPQVIRVDDCWEVFYLPDTHAFSVAAFVSFGVHGETTAKASNDIAFSSCSSMAKARKHGETHQVHK